MLKKIKDIFLAILTVFIVIIVIVVVGINYFGGLTGKVRNGENFCINKEYSIGKMLGGYNGTFFCYNKISNKCINGIKTYSLGKNKDLYLVFKPGRFVGKSEKDINDSKIIYNYSIFTDSSNMNYAKNYYEIIRFLKVNYNDCSIKFYSNNDMQKINKEDKEIFTSLDK